MSFKISQKKEFLLYIDGQYVESESHNTISVENPATKEIIAKVPRGNEKDVDKAVKAAYAAFESFSNLDLVERIKIIENFRDYLLENKEFITECIRLELGSPITYTQNHHFMRNIHRINAFLEIAKNYDYEKNLDNLIIRKEPIGVIAAITPWNFPMGQIIQKVIPALLTGNTIVLKPSQNTPLTAYYFADGLEKSGLPKGVFNLITGVAGEVGNALSTHELVSKVSFTGSTYGGAEVGKLAISKLKPTTLELGGKSASVFIDNENLEQNIKTSLNGVFGNTGQVCAALTRLIVLKQYQSELENAILRIFNKYTVDLPENNPFMGPLSSKKQYDKVIEYINDGKKRLDVLIEGNYDFSDKNGYFVNPIIFNNVSENDRLAQEEIFGPVLVIIPVDSIDEALKVANNSKYGLSGAVFGNYKKALSFAKKVKTGTIQINRTKGNIKAPFGGYKESGFGREGGVEGFEEYLITKSILI